MLLSTSMLIWLGLAVVLYFVGFELASRVILLIEQNTAAQECPQAEHCCRELNFYRWISAAGAFAAALMAAFGVDFPAVLPGVVAAWVILTLFETVRVLGALRIVSSRSSSK